MPTLIFDRSTRVNSFFYLCHKYIYRSDVNDFSVKFKFVQCRADCGWCNRGHRGPCFDCSVCVLVVATASSSTTTYSGRPCPWNPGWPSHGSGSHSCQQHCIFPRYHAVNETLRKSLAFSNCRSNVHAGPFRSEYISLSVDDFWHGHCGRFPALFKPRQVVKSEPAFRSTVRY